MAIALDVIATPENFDEAGYLAANPDVADAYRRGLVRNPRQHFDKWGRKEGRRVRLANSVAEMRERKLQRLEPVLNLDMPHVRRGAKYDFLTAELRTSAAIVDTTDFSANEYDAHTLALIGKYPNGLILDCGAGQRPTYHPNVVNYEIVDYESTDVLGVGEALPFKDNSFDGVISVAVLEHVRDPFGCADELVRVLKPGGALICCVPFLQPLHGFPHHYYNMTGQGVRALFERKLDIDDQAVIDSTLPIWSLTWILKSWAEGLSGKARAEFLSLRIEDLLANPAELLDRPWVRQLPDVKNFELASATLLFAHKPSAR